jgi:hypothetical protein
VVQPAVVLFARFSNRYDFLARLELTPEGIKKESSVDRSASIRAGKNST